MSRFNDSTEFTLQFSSLFLCRQKKCKRVARSVLPSRFPLKIGLHFSFWGLKGAMSRYACRAMSRYLLPFQKAKTFFASIEFQT